MISYELRTILTFLIAYFSVMFVIPKLANIARAIGLVDRPCARKVHKNPRPLVGGIGIVIAATFSSMLFVEIEGLRGLFLGLAILLFIGFLDDFRELGPRRKFASQIVASFLMIHFSKATLVSFGDLFGFGPILVPQYALVIWLVTIFCMVGVINSINLIDGLDGLAGGISFIAFLTFALHASFAEHHVLTLLNLAFAGSVLGFLRFNWSPSVVFMGDAGSLCLGFALGFMAIIMTQGGEPIMSPICPLLILAVPITDTLIVMCKRILKGRNPFRADRYHLHHIFMRYGMSREVAVKTILTISLLLALSTLAVPYFGFPEHYLFGAYLVYFFVYVVSSFFIIYTMRLSFRYRKKHGKRFVNREWGALFIRSVLNKVDLLKIFRKDIRYPVSSDVECTFQEDTELFAGVIVNISKRGCMVKFPDLEILKEDVKLRITPLVGENPVIEVPAEHLWVSEGDNEYFHGFRFKGMSEELKGSLQQYLSVLVLK